MWFEDLSRLKINLEKVKFFQWTLWMENITELAQDFGGVLPSFYLGLLLGAPFKRTSVGMELRRECIGG